MGERDLERFERIILPHLDDAYTLARYLLRDEHDAQDAVQDAVLRALRHFDGYREGDARAWLLSIVRNQCYTARSGRRRDPFGATIAGTPELEPADPRAADELAIRSSEHARLHAALQTLPDDMREAIVLRELSELSYREIAGITGVPIGTVMSRLARARARLAASLGAGEREAS